jgi:hypothetical protein
VDCVEVDVRLADADILPVALWLGVAVIDFEMVDDPVTLCDADAEPVAELDCEEVWSCVAVGVKVWDFVIDCDAVADDDSVRACVGVPEEDAV